MNDVMRGLKNEKPNISPKQKDMHSDGQTRIAQAI
jgi:hypothetical protein